MQIYFYELENYFEKNGYLGYDPYDVFDTKIFHKLKKHENIFLIKILLIIYEQVCMLFPRLVRFLFVSKSINHKSVALMGLARINRFINTKNKIYLKKAQQDCEFLFEEFKIHGQTKNLSFGYPFHWYSPIPLPAYTPSGIVSVHCGLLFLKTYELTGLDKYKRWSIEVANFCLDELNQFENEKSEICFSYTPLDNYCVHNVNLFVSHYLITLGKKFNNKKYFSFGKKSFEFSFNSLPLKGYLPYWAKNSKSVNIKLANHIDHYHTSYELRLMYEISNELEDNFIKLKVEDKVKQYFYDFYTNENFPKYSPKSLYPINFATITESIYMRIIFSKIMKFSDEDNEKYIKSVLNRVSYKKNKYSYQIRKFFGLSLIVKGDFHRWIYSWLYYVLSFKS